MRDHDDEALARDLLDKIHDLHAGFGIERARRLVREQDLRVVYEGARDGDALHLPARKLIGLFVQLAPQPDAPQRVCGAFAPFLRGYARQREREFDVPQNGLMGNEVVRLKNKPDAVVAVGVPVGVFIILCGNALYDQVAVRIVVEPADDVEQRRFPAARMPEHGNKLLLAEREADTLERVYGAVRHFVIFFDAFQP